MLPAELSGTTDWGRPAVQHVHLTATRIHQHNPKCTLSPPPSRVSNNSKARDVQGSYQDVTAFGSPVDISALRSHYTNIRVA